MYSSRFLRARKFNLNETKRMVKNCQHWRQTVSGIGIDELNNRMDPFDVSNKCCEILVVFDHPWSKCPGREEVFKSWSMYFHKVCSSFHYKHFGLGSMFLCQTDKVSGTTYRCVRNSSLHRAERAAREYTVLRWFEPSGTLQARYARKAGGIHYSECRRPHSRSSAGCFPCSRLSHRTIVRHC